MKQQSTMPKHGGVAWWGQWLVPAGAGGGTLTAGQRGRRAVRGDGFAVTEWADTEWDDTQSAQLAEPNSHGDSQ
jgi:hypothetical protein